MRRQPDTPENLWERRIPARSRNSFVGVVQPAEDGAGADRAVCRPDPLDRRAELPRPVRSLGDVERRVLGQDRAGGRLVEDDEMIRALAAKGPDDPIAYRRPA